MALIYSFNTNLITNFVQEIHIAPLSEGSGSIVAFEVEDLQQRLRGVRHRFRVVAVAVDDSLAPTATLLETRGNERERLLDAVTVQGAGRAVLLGRREDLNIDIRHPEAAELVTRYWLRGLQSGPGFNSPVMFLDGDWPGKVAGARYVAECLGGRLVTGTDFLVVARRVNTVGPDDFEVALVALRIDAFTLAVQSELVLNTTGIVLGDAFNDDAGPFSDVTCTPSSLGSGDGWVVAYSAGNSVVANKINGEVTRELGPSTLWSAPSAGMDAGARLEEFRVAGATIRRSSSANVGFYAVAIRMQMPDGTSRIRMTTFDWNSGPIAVTAPTTVGSHVLGPTLGGFRFALDSTTQSHWILLHRRRVDTGLVGTRFCRVGATGSVYERFDLNALDSGYGVEHDHARDRVLIASIAAQPELGVMLRADQRTNPLAVVQGSGECGKIGDAYSRRTGSVRDKAAEMPIPGHRFFEVRLDDGPPSRSVALCLSRRTVSAPAGARCPFILDMDAPGALTADMALTNASGEATASFSLSEQDLDPLFNDEHPSFAATGELLDYPRVLFAQWTWSDTIFHDGGIDPRTGERTDPRIERVQRGSSVLLLNLST